MVVRCEHLRVIGLLTQDYCPLVMVLLAALVDPFQRSISLSIVAREQPRSQMKRLLASLLAFPSGKRAWALPCTHSVSNPS